MPRSVQGWPLPGPVRRLLRKPRGCTPPRSSPQVSLPSLLASTRILRAERAEPNTLVTACPSLPACGPAHADRGLKGQAGPPGRDASPSSRRPPRPHPLGGGAPGPIPPAAGAAALSGGGTACCGATAAAAERA